MLAAFVDITILVSLGNNRPTLINRFLPFYLEIPMALFPTHAGTSLVLGGAYAAGAHIGYGVPLPSCLLAGGLCTIAGMLPDVDSDNAIIFREVLTFAAAVTPMLLLDHFRELGWDQESIVVASGLVYVVIRFGLGEVIRRTTVHRGMWHSIPAAAIASLVIFMLCACPELNLRLFKTSAVALGYLWHLVLDEMYAVETGMLTIRKKKSFGTAFKFFGKNAVGNFLVYGLLATIVGSIVMFPPSERIAHGHEHHGHKPDPQTQLTPVPGSHVYPGATQPAPGSQPAPTHRQPATPQPPFPNGGNYAWPPQPYTQPYTPPGQSPANNRGSWHWNR